MTVRRVRKHLLEEGKSEHWMIFEELALAPLVPGRVPKTRAELLAMFPGEGPAFLDNRMTTVKRVFRRILPALIPVDPTESLTPEQRFQELLDILQASANSRLWLAFLLDPTPSPEESTGSSLDLSPLSVAGDESDAAIAPEILQDELRILLRFWLEMPLQDYLGNLDSMGPAATGDAPPPTAWCPTRTIPRRRASVEPEIADRRDAARGPRRLARGVDGPVSTAQDLRQARPSFRETGPGRRRGMPHAGPAGSRIRCHSRSPRSSTTWPGALALTRCDTRIIGLSDAQYRKNVAWVLNQTWLDARLRPVFFAALSQLRTASRS